MDSPRPVYLLYHFFYPDDVVSGRLFADLAEDLTEAGYEVTALPSIRSCHGAKVRLQQRQTWIGGKIRRVWRPDWPQHKTWGRFGNTLCMLMGWTWRAAVMRRRPGEVMIVGTDPVLGVLISVTWRLLRPRAKIIHWCHDVYPHAAVADGMIRDDAPWVRLIHWLLRIAYRRCDVIGDLGICMRRLLQRASGDPVDPLDDLNDAMADSSGADRTLATEVSPPVEQLVGDRDARAVIAELAAGLSDENAADRSVMRWDAAGALVQLATLDGFGRRRGASTPEYSADPYNPDVHNPDVQPPAALRSVSHTHWRSGRYATLVPWSLVEPARLPKADPLVRAELFGDAPFGLLYSGNFGRGHCFQSVLTLARRLRGDAIGICFAGRGLRLASVQSNVTAEDTNISFAGFAAETQLEARLGAADVHLVTLRTNWTGAVVPSKFFGALAAGRPVLFAGSPDSAIAHWIAEFGLGWVLTQWTVDQIARDLRRYAADVAAQEALRQRCFDVYHRHFSRRVQVARWLRILSGEPPILRAGEPVVAREHADPNASLPLASEGCVATKPRENGPSKLQNPVASV